MLISEIVIENNTPDLFKAELTKINNLIKEINTLMQADAKRAQLFIQLTDDETRTLKIPTIQNPTPKISENIKQLLDNWECNMMFAVLSSEQLILLGDTLLPIIYRKLSRFQEDVILLIHQNNKNKNIVEYAQLLKKIETSKNLITLIKKNYIISIFFRYTAYYELQYNQNKQIQNTFDNELLIFQYRANTIYDSIYTIDYDQKDNFKMSAIVRKRFYSILNEAGCIPLPEVPDLYFKKITDSFFERIQEDPLKKVTQENKPVYPYKDEYFKNIEHYESLLRLEVRSTKNLYRIFIYYAKILLSITSCMLLAIYVSVLLAFTIITLIIGFVLFKSYKPDYYAAMHAFDIIRMTASFMNTTPDTLEDINLFEFNFFKNKYVFLKRNIISAISALHTMPENLQVTIKTMLQDLDEKIELYLKDYAEYIKKTVTINIEIYKSLSQEDVALLIEFIQLSDKHYVGFDCSDIFILKLISNSFLIRKEKENTKIFNELGLDLGVFKYDESKITEFLFEILPKIQAPGNKKTTLMEVCRFLLNRKSMKKTEELKKMIESSFNQEQQNSLMYGIGHFKWCTFPAKEENKTRGFNLIPEDHKEILYKVNDLMLYSFLKSDPHDVDAKNPEYYRGYCGEVVNLYEAINSANIDVTITMPDLKLIYFFESYNGASINGLQFYILLPKESQGYYVKKCVTTRISYILKVIAINPEKNHNMDIYFNVELLNTIADFSLAKIIDAYLSDLIERKAILRRTTIEKFSIFLELYSELLSPKKTSKEIINFYKKRIATCVEKNTPPTSPPTSLFQKSLHFLGSPKDKEGNSVKTPDISSNMNRSKFSIV